MKYLILGFNLFCRNIILNLILVLQLVVATVLINMALGLINSYFIIQTYFEKIADEKGAYFMPLTEAIHNPHLDVDSDIDDVLAELKEVKEVSTIYKYYFKKDGNCYLATSYDSYISRKIKLALSKGVWYSDSQVEEGIVPVVVSSQSKGFEIGRVIPVTIYDPSNDPSGEEPAVKLKVVGVLKPPPYILSYSGGGSATSSDRIFNRYNEKFVGAPAIIFERSALGEYTDYYLHRDPFLMVFFNDSITEAVYNNNLEKMAKRGFVQPIDQMYLEGEKKIKDEIKYKLPLIICILSISLIGMVSLNILNTLLHRKVFAIFYICGSRWKNCLWILLAYMLFMVFLSLLILLVIFYLATQNGTIIDMGIYISFNNVLVTFGVNLAIIILSLVIPNIILKNTYPIQIIRGN
jgi:hypothetical protein